MDMSRQLVVMRVGGQIVIVKTNFDNELGHGARAAHQQHSTAHGSP